MSALFQPKDAFKSTATKTVTVADVAAAKHLPESLLTDLGWKNERRGIRIPYRNLGGQTASRAHIRRTLTKTADGPKFIWDGPDTVSLLAYGEWRLDEARRKKRLIVAEGETDTITCWHAGLPAIGIPGASTVRTTFRPDHLRDIEHVVIAKDSDHGGEVFITAVHAVATAAGVPKITVLTMPTTCKDLNDWYRQAGSVETFRQQLKDAVAAAPVAAMPASEPVAPPPPIAFTSIGDLLAEPDEAVEWLVKDRIPRGGVVALGGKPKAGKSTLSRDLALAVATGDRWLGHDCIAGPVWYVAFEDRRSDVKRHMRQMGATGNEPIRFVFPQRVEDLLGKLHAFAAIERPALIIVDTMQRLVQVRDLNDYAQVTEKLTPVINLARETGAAVVLVHHAGKGERAGIDALLGSTAIAGSVDNVFVFARTDKYRLLSSVQRVGPDLPDSLVLLDPSTGRATLGAVRADADVAEMSDRIRAVLADSPKPLEEKELAGQVEGKTALKSRALRVLVGAGRVDRSGAGKRGDPFTYQVSPTLNPASIREGEKEKVRTPVTTSPRETNSPSRVAALIEPRERAFGEETGRERVRF